MSELTTSKESRLKLRINSGDLSTFSKLLNDQTRTVSGDVISLEILSEWGMNSNRISELQSLINSGPINVPQINEHAEPDELKRLREFKSVDHFLTYISDNGISSELIKQAIDLDERDIEDLKKNSSLLPVEIDEESQPSIPDDHTDIYFIGTPGSGKTCVIGALLESIKRSGKQSISTTTRNQNGQEYMNYLKNCLSKRLMPVSTSSDASVFMSLDVLESPGETKRKYKWNIIEMAGERLKNTFKGEEPDINPNDWFGSGNRKVINFVIDFDYQDSELLQDSILNLAYAQLKQWKVFKQVDLVNILITKIDLDQDKDWYQYAEQKVREDFSTLLNSLKADQKGGIFNRNKYSLKIIPMSIGRDFKFDGAFMKSPERRYVNDLLEVLLSETYSR